MSSEFVLRLVNISNISINKFGSNGTKLTKQKNNTITNKKASNIEYKNVKCVKTKPPARPEVLIKEEK